MSENNSKANQERSTLFDANPCPVLILEDDTILAANRAAGQLFQTAPDQLGGRSIHSLLSDGKGVSFTGSSGGDSSAPVRRNLTIRTPESNEKEVGATFLFDDGELTLILHSLDGQAPPRPSSERDRDLRSELRSSVQSLADTLQVRHTFLAELDREAGTARMILFSDDGTLREPFEMDAENSVLNDLDRSATCISNEARDNYPDDELLEKYNIEGFAGILCAPAAEDNGDLLLCAMDPLGIWDVSDTDTLLDVYAERIREQLTHLREERAIRQSEESYRVLFQDHPEPMWVYDVDSLKILDVNASALDTYGYDRDEFLEMSIKELRPEQQVDDLLAMLEDASEIRQSQEALHMKKDGTRMEMEISSRRITFRGHDARLVIARDVTDRKEAMRKIERLARYDSLTDLPNRSYFSERLEEAIRANAASDDDHNIAVLCLDLEGFNAVNDVLGHSVGDRVLQRLARRFAECVPDHGMIARWGGDEFTIFLPKLDSTDPVETVVEKLREVLEEPFDVKDYEFQIGGAVGGALCPRDGTGPEELIGKADLAMMRAQEQPNQFFQFYVEGGIEETSEELQLVHDLNNAIDNDEFKLHYHPLINCQSGVLSGCEALIRWEHPERGELSPGAFLPQTEATGMIVSIGEWVLRRACEQLVSWNQDRQEPLSVAVNVSVKQIQAEGFLDTLKEVLNSTGAQPEHLQIELTEKTLMTDLDRAENLMEELRRMGVQVAIDDFGTGYSSLEYLMRLPVDILKIDRSFTEIITDEPYVMELFHMVQTMARRLDFDVVVEGVESYQVLKEVMDKEFTYLQGFLFSEPLPPRRFRNRMDDTDLIEPLNEV